MKKNIKTNGGKVIPTVAGKIGKLVAAAGRSLERVITSLVSYDKAREQATASRDAAIAAWKEVKEEVTDKKERKELAKFIHATLKAAPFNLTAERATAALKAIGLQIRASASRGIEIPPEQVNQMVTLAQKLGDDNLEYMAALLYRTQNKVRQMKKDATASEKERAAKGKK